MFDACCIRKRQFSEIMACARLELCRFNQAVKMYVKILTTLH